MSDFPEDIMRAAELAVAGREHITGDLHHAFVEDVADALVKERERCAKIAEAEASKHIGDGGWVAQAIARQIRGEV